MNNEKDFFVNDIEINVSEEEIVLASETELFEEAKAIAQTTVAAEKFPFTLQYDANQKEFLLSMLETVGAVVEADDEEGHKLNTRMNMTQLAFIKRLDCVERVRTDEGRNPFLAMKAERPKKIEVSAEPAQTAQVMTLSADEPARAADDAVAVASAGAMTRSACSCPTNTDMATAQEIVVERMVSGCICCPGAEQWFKFTVPRARRYTIFTTGFLDIEGALYDCNRNRIDDETTNVKINGNLNLMIRCILSPRVTYYLCISDAKQDTGNYTLKVIEGSLAEEVFIEPERDDGIVLLELGKTYQLPRGREYGFVDVENILDAPLSVEVSPFDADRRVFWYASSVPSDPVDINHEWYNSITKYQTIKANSVGATKLYARDWNEHGKVGVAYVVVAPSISEFVKASSFKICKEGSTTEITELNMEIGEYQKVMAEVSPSNATVQNVNWVSTNSDVATITPYGRIKAVSPGTTTVRAEAMDGSGVYGCCEVTCSPHAYRAVLTNDGDEYTFTCATPQCNESFTVSKDQVIGSYVTSSTDPRLGNSQTPLAYGIDVSYAQEEISQSQWNEIANTQIDGHPITFAILRIGIDLADENDIIIGREKDVRFENNYVRAKAAGLHVGCYYYTKSLSTQCAIAAAEQVIEWIGNKQFEYPVFFDIESERILNNVPNKSTRSEICLAFMNKMREAGFFTGFYANNDWIKNKLDSSMLLPEYDVWYARWYDNTPNNWQNNWAGAGKKFGMWQYTRIKNIAPITENTVDCNVAYKNYPLIIKALHLNNFN